MEILSGTIEVLLPESSEWQTFKGGERFEVPSSSGFRLKVLTVTDYCCSFIA